MVQKIDFEKQIGEKNISLYTLENKNGIKLSVTNFGARVVELWTPDKDGNSCDIVLGYDHIDKYLNNVGERFLGAACGRYANRIANGHFRIGDKEYNLPINNNGQTLHGGIKGLDSVIWDVVAYSDEEIHFRYISPDMEEGFPGKLTIDMFYSLNENNEFKISYQATTDKPTVVNLTHHSFFNLHGEGEGNINDHILQINGDQYIPINKQLIPLGNYQLVKDTPMDFSLPTPIGKRLSDPYEQLEIANGYDHCWILAETKKENVELAATVLDPVSGRYMEMWTDQPGIQFYGGNFFDGKMKSKNGIKTYDFRGALALETQHFPDSPNQPTFPSTLLKPNQEYKHTCFLNSR